MMPKVRVRPAASRNISSPSCTPFRTWIRASMTCHPEPQAPALSEAEGRDLSCGAKIPRYARDDIGVSAPVSLHRALLVVGVLAVLHRGGDGLHGHQALRVLDRLLDVEVLDRELVGVELEVAAQRLEVGLLQ